jgi:hypothetical protein
MGGFTGDIIPAPQWEPITPSIEEEGTDWNEEED